MKNGHFFLTVKYEIFLFQIEIKLNFTLLLSDLTLNNFFNRQKNTLKCQI